MFGRDFGGQLGFFFSRLFVSGGCSALRLCLVCSGLFAKRLELLHTQSPDASTLYAQEFGTSNMHTVVNITDNSVHRATIRMNCP